MSKRQILEYLLETNTSVSVPQMCVSLLMALVLGIFIYIIYRATYRGTLYSKNFNLTLILIVLITTVVMMIIGTRAWAWWAACPSSVSVPPSRNPGTSPSSSGR